MLSAEDIDFVATHTNGFTGADLRLLLTEASLSLMDTDSDVQTSLVMWAFHP